MKANHDIFYPRNSMSTPLSRRISLEKVLLPVRVVNVRVLATTFVDIELLVLVLILLFTLHKRSLPWLSRPSYLRSIPKRVLMPFEQMVVTILVVGGKSTSTRYHPYPSQASCESGADDTPDSDSSVHRA